MKKIISLVVLSLVVWNLQGCGTLNTSSSSSSNYRDVYNGFSIYVPSGWSVQTSSGNILVAKDSAGLTGAIVYPAQLLTAESHTAKQFMALYFSAVSNITSGSSTTALTWTGSSETDSNSASGTYSGKINGTDVNGEIYCARDSKDIICKLYWGPTSTFGSDKETLQSIASSYSKLPYSDPDFVFFTNKDYSYTTPNVGSASFRVSYPSSGWKVEGTGRGIDLSTADSSEGVSLGALYPVSRTASGFVDYTIGQLQAAGYTSVSTSEPKSDFPQIVDNLGYTWNFYSETILFTAPWGTQYKGIIYSGVSSLGSGAIAGSGMLTLKFATTDKWDSVRDKLTAMESRIIILSIDNTDANIKYPQPQPADSSSIMSSWEYKNRVDDRLSAIRQEATMGYERAESTITGKKYDMPLNSYDNTKGAYHNPEKSDDLLIKVN